MTCRTLWGLLVKRRLVLFAMVLTAGAAPALANAGTPLMWAGCCHLVFGNAVIGALEGFLLARWFKARVWTAILVMIAANYTSAWLGYLVMWSGLPLEWGAGFPQVTIENVVTFHIWALALAFLGTVVIEWPFCVALAWKCPHRWRLATLGCVAVQAISYMLLALIVLPFSPLSPGLRVAVEPPDAAPPPVTGWVYFLTHDQREVRRVRLAGGATEHVVHVPGADGIGDELDHLCLHCEGEWAHLCRQGHARREGRVELLRQIIPCPQAPDCYIDVDESHVGVWCYPYSPPGDLRDPQQSSWQVHCGFWGVEGVTARNRETDERLRVAVETPFIAWWPRFATVLPGDIVVYQLGDQVVRLDLNRRRMSLLALGHSPLVLLDPESATQPASEPANASSAPATAPPDTQAAP